MSKFILIQNVGVAPTGAFTLLGASNKAGSEAIGQFGSGTKLGTISLLREKLAPTIYCGGVRIVFGTKPIDFDGAPHEQITVTYSGKDGNKTINRTEDLSVVLNYGSVDWVKPVLAVREYISNAIDTCDEYKPQITGQGENRVYTLRDSDGVARVTVELVDEPRAKAGHTRVFVPYTADTREIFDNLSQWFLHFSGREWKGQALLEKDRISPALIYRRGVFVREVSSDEPNSLFDYNLDELTLDEARVASDFSVRWEACRSFILKATVAQIGKLLTAKTPVLEHRFDLNAGRLPETHKTTRTKVWQKAAAEYLGSATVIVPEQADVSQVVAKGYKPLIVPLNLEIAARSYGLPVRETILNAHERSGRILDAEASPALVTAAKDVWDVLALLGKTRGESFPQIQTYSQELSGGSRTLGLYQAGVVYLNNCLISGGEADGYISDDLFATLLEEFAHHITKATDNSRDFQEFFIQVAVRLLNKK